MAPLGAGPGTGGRGAGIPGRAAPIVARCMGFMFGATIDGAAAGRATPMVGPGPWIRPWARA